MSEPKNLQEHFDEMHIEVEKTKWEERGMPSDSEWLKTLKSFNNDSSLVAFLNSFDCDINQIIYELCDEIEYLEERQESLAKDKNSLKERNDELEELRKFVRDNTDKLASLFENDNNE